MSPEIQRASKGWRIHEGRRKAEERRNQPLVTLPSWDTVSGIIDLRTHNSPDASNLINNHRELLKFFYDAWFDVAARKGRKKLRNLSRRYTENTKSKYYNPELIDTLAPYISIVRDSFPSLANKRR